MLSCEALPTGIPVSGPLPASVIMLYAISATQHLHMRSISGRRTYTTIW